ncbi:TRAP transporter small permease [Mesobacillus maritimus]|uniref:TRAP transporter small permease n=1 Tax=Mesobacillus maritimus TaxID=1643336 RepID=UPI0038516F0C
MNKIIDRINQVSLILSGIALAGLMILISAGVFTRYVLSFSIPTAYEIVENYLMPIAVFAALGYSYYSGIFPRVDAFTEKIQNVKLKKVIDGAIIIVEFLTFLFVSYYLFQFSLYSIDNGMGFKTNGINFPLYPVHFILFLAFLWMCVLILLKFIRTIKGKDQDQIN